MLATLLQIPERPMSLALAFAQGGQRVGRLPALADHEDEGVACHRQVAIAQFAGKFALNRKVGERFDEVFADHRGVKGRAAAAQDDSLDLAKFGVAHLEAAELGRRLLDRKPSAHGIAHRVRLLEDFLEHEMRELSLVHVLRHELDLADLEARIGTRERGNIEIISP